MAKPFAAFDVDGTIFKSSLVEKVVEGCIEVGIFDAEPFNETYANKSRWQNENNEGVYQAYLGRLVGTFINQMADIEVEEFDQVTATMIDQHAVRKFAFPRKLIKALRTSHHMVAISGSPDILVKPFLADLDIDASYGSRFEVEDGKFTGVAASVGDKEAILRGLVKDGTVTTSGSVAIGDTLSDIPMLTYADTAIMFNACKTLTNYGSEFEWLRVNEVKDQITALASSSRFGAYIEINPDSIAEGLRSHQSA
jgi:HAD superfamily phosphoserine phosphatase-like hydrolase